MPCIVVLLEFVTCSLHNNGSGTGNMLKNVAGRPEGTLPPNGFPVTKSKVLTGSGMADS